MSEERLTRIEDKLDKMGEAITLLARMEERMITLFKRMDKYDTEHRSLSDRVSGVEKVTVQRGVVYHAAEKLIWIVVGVLAAVVIKGSGGSQ